MLLSIIVFITFGTFSNSPYLLRYLLISSFQLPHHHHHQLPPLLPLFHLPQVNNK
uniref:Candidate secreted effector n=1 Tax=Meloidogyne incognita TaxID=6306 RepID=A0A914MKX2_MELIC